MNKYYVHEGYERLFRQDTDTGVEHRWDDTKTDWVPIPQAVDKWQEEAGVDLTEVTPPEATKRFPTATV